MKHEYTETHLKNHEYTDGPRVLEKFKKMMIQVFQAPKSDTPFAKPKAKKAASTAISKKRVPVREHEDAAG